MDSKFEKLKAENWEGQKSVFSERPETSQVQILPDDSVSRGHFRPHSKLVGIYYAHPVTIRALKTEVWVAGQEIDFFAGPVECQSCKTLVDRQFWHFCPFCENSLPKV